MSEISAVLGLGAEFVFEGTTYRVAPCCYLVKGQYENYLEGEAMRAIMNRVGEVSDYVVRELLSIYTRDCAAKVYHFDGSVSVRSRELLPGRKRLAALQLHKGHPGLTNVASMDLVEKIFDSGEAAITALESSMARADADPNVPKPYRKSVTPG